MIDPVLHAEPPIHEYVQGSWGPAAAAGILADGDHWHDPRPARRQAVLIRNAGTNH